MKIDTSLDSDNSPEPKSALETVLTATTAATYWWAAFQHKLPSNHEKWTPVMSGAAIDLNNILISRNRNVLNLMKIHWVAHGGVTYINSRYGHPRWVFNLKLPSRNDLYLENSLFFMLVKAGWYRMIFKRKEKMNCDCSRHYAKNKDKEPIQYLRRVQYQCRHVHRSSDCIRYGWEAKKYVINEQSLGA